MRSTIRRRVGSRLRALRRDRRMTQEELADRGGLSRNFVGYIEQGRKMPAIETLEAICHALDVSLAEFFDFRDEEATKTEALGEITMLLRDRPRRSIRRAREILEKVFGE